MTISLIPDSLLNQLRLQIGDTDSEYITDGVLVYLLNENSNNVTSTAIKAVKIILADLAKLRDESVDEVYVKWSQVFDHYKEIYKNLIKSSGLSVDAGAFWFGGASKADNCDFYENDDNFVSPIKTGFISEVKSLSYDPDHPFSLRG